MKKFYLLLSFMLVFMSGMAQNMVSYAYDNAGNRISRKIVPIGSNPNHAKKSAEPDPVVEQLGERKITVYPNPTRGALAVEVTGGNTNDAIRLIVFSAQGTQLQSLRVTATKTPIDMTAYPDGWYIMRITAGGKSTEFKIVKQ